MALTLKSTTTLNNHRMLQQLASHTQQTINDTSTQGLDPRPLDNNDVYNGNASLSGSSGGPLSRAGIYAQGGAVQNVGVNGGLVQCQMAGPSPTPCEIYTSHIRGKMGPNPIELSYFTTFSLPRPGLSPSSEFYRGKVRNRNSATISARPIYRITDIWPGRTNSFMVPAYDRDGDLVKTYVCLCP